MMGAYRYDDYANPAIYSASVVAFLEEIPDPVIEQLTSPKCGIQTECAKPPSLVEIRVRCERIERTLSNIALGQARRERKSVENAHLPPVVDRSKRLTAEEMRERYPYWLGRDARAQRCGDPLRPRTRWEPPTLKELAAQAGKSVTDGDIAAIPDAKLPGFEPVGCAATRSCVNNTAADQEELARGI